MLDGTCDVASHLVFQVSGGTSALANARGGEESISRMPMKFLCLRFVRRLVISLLKHLSRLSAITECDRFFFDHAVAAFVEPRKVLHLIRHKFLSMHISSLPIRTAILSLHSIHALTQPLSIVRTSSVIFTFSPQPHCLTRPPSGT